MLLFDSEFKKRYSLIYLHDLPLLFTDTYNVVEQIIKSQDGSAPLPVIEPIVTNETIEEFVFPTEAQLFVLSENSDSSDDRLHFYRLLL